LLDPGKRAVYREYRKLGAKLKTVLRLRCGEADQRILTRIGSRDSGMRVLQAFDDLLLTWEKSRKREILEDMGTTRIEWGEEGIDELNLLRDKLRNLEAELNRLNPCVVQMLRQAVQLGVREIDGRLKQAPEAKKG
jgi:hypothetical protein